MVYRKEIDGLRAVAVLPVIFFHAGFDIFSGGYTGVDVFFVISGYLITSIILNEKEAGTFTITNFYERRARRILPALFFVIMATLPFAWHWMLPDQLKDYSQSLVAVSIFSSNILFWMESGYFEAAAELKPFLHTWSLAVEEQYYILFPLLILLLWRFGKKFIFATLALIGITSLLVAHYKVANNPSANFYLLQTRLWELLIGSLTAFYHSKNPQQPDKSGFHSITNQALSALGLLLILYAIFTFNKQTPFPSLYALAPTIGTALIILFASERTCIGYFLSNKLFVGIGLISYSAYLWHQPIFSFARLRSTNEPGEYLMIMLGMLSLLLAYITWKFVEQPFRNKTLFSRTTIFRNAAILSILIIGIGTLGNTYDGFANRTTAYGVSFAESNINNRIQVNYGLNKACENISPSPENCRTHDKPEILLWGDSFAMHLAQGILASNPDARIIQMTKSLCGPVIGLAPTNKNFPPRWADECIDFNNTVVQWLNTNNSIRFAALGSPFYQYLSSDWQIKTGNSVHAAEKKEVFEYFTSTLDFLISKGIQPVVFAPPPSNGKNIGACLAKATIFGDNTAKCNVRESEYKTHQKSIIQFLKLIDKQYRVIWVSEEICSNSNCNAEIENRFIYRDKMHFSHEGSAFIGKKMDFYKLITSS